MNLTKTYKWLTYFLAIPTSIIALFALIGVLIAFANPQFLIPVFVLVCIVLYIISSYIFLNKVLIKQGNCRKVIKDLIKINAFASLFFSILNIIQFITILSTPSFVDATIAGILEQNQASFSRFF